MEAVAPMSSQSKRFDLPSGAILVVNVAPFKDAWALMKASLKTLKGMNIDPEMLKKDIKALSQNPSVISVFLDRIVEFATSPEVESALWQCAHRALYIPPGSPVEFPGEHINPQMFDSLEFGNQAREDYARIVAGIMEVNCAPFLAQALSGLKKATAASSESPK